MGLAEFWWGFGQESVGPVAKMTHCEQSFYVTTPTIASSNLWEIDAVFQRRLAGEVHSLSSSHGLTEGA